MTVHMGSTPDLAERIASDDPYLVEYLFGWAGLGDVPRWGAATGFAMEVAAGYGLIKGESDATLTDKGKAVVAALEARGEQP